MVVTDNIRDSPACHDHRDRKSTRLNSSHLVISYAVFCLKKKNNLHTLGRRRVMGAPIPLPVIAFRDVSTPRQSLFQARAAVLHMLLDATALSSRVSGHAQ